MILILSMHQDDATSNVIDWLNFFRKKFQRVNYEEQNDVKIELTDNKEDIVILNKGQKITLNKLDSYWYRRGNFNVTSEKFTKSNSITDCFNTFFFDEKSYLISFLHQRLKENIISINGYEDVFLNKLTVLTKAKKYGLLIPDTLVTQSKKDVFSFFKKHGQIITKPIREGFSCNYKDINYYLHTILLNKKDIEAFPEKFNYLLFQKALNKKYELRIFYLNEQFYASAIFSQNDDKTKVDFRNYNEEKPNRVIPYSIPIDLKKKLKRLMKDLKLNSGSFDIVLTKDHKYVFLEVNPIGQFSQVSQPCNFFLEEKIALSLLHNEK